MASLFGAFVVKKRACFDYIFGYIILALRVSYKKGGGGNMLVLSGCGNDDQSCVIYFVLLTMLEIE